jgi:hypothetical protein
MAMTRSIFSWTVEDELLHVMPRRSLPSFRYRQQRAIIDVVRGASLSEEKKSVKTHDTIAVSQKNLRQRALS